MQVTHDSNDIRIFVKECSSLANAGYEVYLVAKGELRMDSTVRVIGVGDVSAWKEFTRVTGTGIYVNPKDSKELATAVKLLLNDPQKAEIMGQKEGLLWRINFHGMLKEKS